MMNKQKKSFYSFLITLLAVLLISGCGSSNSDSGASVDTTTATQSSIGKINVSLVKSNITVDTNNIQTVITVRAYDDNNVPAQTGKVKIVYPNKVQTGSDVGQFSPLEAKIVNGIATFTYIAPADLQSLIDSGDTSSVFSVYAEGNIVNAKTLTVNYAPKVGQVVEKNYALSLLGSDNSQLIPLESLKTFTAQVNDDKGEALANSDIVSMNISNLNPNIASINYSGVISDNITANVNRIFISLKSNTTSGIVPIKIVTVFKDYIGMTKTIEKVFNVVILSGPPTAISLSYAGTEQDSTKAKFIEKWVISATDKYFNPINTSPAMSMGMIAGYASTDGSYNDPTKWIYIKPSAVNSGTLTSASTSTFGPTNTTSLFGAIDVSNDVLTTFGNGYTYNVSGKWDFTKASNSLLNLKDAYSGANTSGLGYAIGHNYRQDQCREGEEWVGQVSSADSNSTLDATGTMRINVSYDYYLTGKDVVLWVNLLGKHNSDGTIVRIGEAKKITLRALGLSGGTMNVSAGATISKTFPIQITGTSEFYRNARFIPEFEVTGKGIVTYTTSMEDTGGIANCIGRNGITYITVTVNASAVSTSDGSTQVIIKNIVGNEF